MCNECEAKVAPLVEERDSLVLRFRSANEHLEFERKENARLRKLLGQEAKSYELRLKNLVEEIARLRELLARAREQFALSRRLPANELLHEERNRRRAGSERGGMKFRSKVVEKEAIQWSGKNLEEIYSFCGPKNIGLIERRLDYKIKIKTLESGDGYHEAEIGDWIIKGLRGEFYPCKPDIFEKSYEAVE
jgi:hypothetical protein